ncbi:MAG: helix-turn-helix domain-containing protein [Clostridiaceae bacterium]|nr:helix-turn-helix domain-containing protein [Clostridiaceae bacterium]
MKKRDQGFFRTFTLNLVIVLMIAASLCMLSVQVRSVIQQGERENSAEVLSAGLSRLTEQLDNVDSAILAMGNKLEAVSKNGIHKYDVVTMLSARDQIKTILSENSLLSDIALVYSDRDLVITKDEIYYSVDDFLNHFRITGMDLSVFWDYTGGSGLATERDQPCESIQRFDYAEVKTAFCASFPLDIQRYTTNRGVAFIFINRESLLNVTVPESLRSYVDFTLYSRRSAGDTLLTAYSPAVGSASDPSFFVQVVNSTGTLSASVTIGNAYLDMRMKTIDQFMIGILLLTLLAGFATALWASRMQNRPMRKVLARLTDRGLLISPDKNVYTGLLDSVENLMEERENVTKSLSRYQTSLRDNLLDRLFSQVTLPPQISETLTAELEDFPDKVLVFCGKIVFEYADTNSSMELVLLMILEFLRRSFPKGTILHSTDTLTFGLLYPMPDGRRVAEEALSAALAEVPKRFSAQVCVICGGETDDIGRVGLFYERAQLLFARTPISERRTGILKPVEEGANTDSQGWRMLQSLYQAMAAGDADSAAEAVKVFFTCPADMETIGLHTRFIVLRTHILLNSRELVPEAPPPYIEQMLMQESPDLFLHRLQEASRIVCANVVEKRRTVADSQFREFLDYLDTHFDDSSLCASSMADEFGMSEKYLFNIFKKKTGYSPVSYLQYIRMRHATELLCRDDMSVQEIAEKVGFSNFGTFYKAFKRQFGIAPSVYREIHQTKLEKRL